MAETVMGGRWTIAAAMLVAGCATSVSEPVNEAAAAKLDNYARTGEKSTCVPLTQVGSIIGVDEKTLLIRSGVGAYYVSDLPGRCRGVTRQGNRIEYTTSTGQLCRGEILRIVDNAGGFFVGSCGMGSFEKLTPKAPAQ
jgi:hypothetical protein